MFFWKVTKHKAVELTFFTEAWSCIIDVSLSLTVGKEQDHAGLLFCLILFGYKIVEFHFYDTRHTDY